ncbi:alpha/beta hydrolase [Pelagibius litoralis]|uniref:Alpha/beta hydrolase n=1 Tax=Pelagibius litoralis TaxID=374515 RepID=A0A967C533_9PROT|nr:alpha/beta hydrolase-fold protein [Pelagibius litoralis]NIA68874.1 alpha/beta hydrolase [Pelagibius litoralis]
MLKLVVSILFTALTLPHAYAAVESPPQGFEIPRSTIHTLESEALGRSYQVYVKTPRDYDAPANKDKIYPVIYLNDGPYTFQVASGATRVPMNWKRYEDAILVGISWAVGEKPMASRTRDLTPSRWADWTARTGHETGGADDYLAFLDSQLMPFVEREYRIDQDRRTLAGHSFGGLFAAWVLFTNPELFKNYIISSPSLWFDRKMMFKVEEDYAAKHQSLKAVVYFGTGEREQSSRNDLTADQIAFVDKLRSRNHQGLIIRDRILEDIDHTTAFPINFTRAFRWLFYKPEN